MSRYFQRMLCLLLLAGLVGCSQHPMNQMIQMQGDMLKQYLQLLRNIEQPGDVKMAMQQFKQIATSQQQKMAQIQASMSSNMRMPSKGEMASMNRKAQSLQSTMTAIVKEIERLSQFDWAKVIVEQGKQMQFNSKVEMKHDHNTDNTDN